MIKLKQFFPKGEFTRNVLTLMTGTAIAQAIPIAISPILTRIYTPEDFGVFALYLAVVSVFNVIATGRYELAIMLPEEDGDAANIVLLSILIAVVVSFFSLIVVFFFNNEISIFLGNPEISGWLYFVPISIFFSGVYQSLKYWNNRNRQYRRMGKSNVLQTSSASITQVGLGLLLFRVGGLITGNLLGLFSGICLLAKPTRDSFFKKKYKLQIEAVITNARQYKKFPLYSSFGALLNSAASQIPVFIISKFFGAASTGFYSMAFKILNKPLTLISGAISKVLFQRVSILHHNNPELLRPFILKIFIILTTVVVPFVVVFFLYGTQIFAWLFGSNWAVAGNYASILSIAVAVRFVVSPLSSVLALEHNLKKGVLWQTVYFFTVTSVLILASKLEILLFLKILVVHEIILYGIYFAIIVKSTESDGRFYY